MKFSLATLLAFLLTSSGFSQQTLTLRPGPTEGKDAYFKTSTPDLNQGDHPDIDALSISSTTIARSAIQFDLTAINPGSTIVNARLSLYHNHNSGNGVHTALNNQSFLALMQSEWHEDSITWNNQPTYDSVNTVGILSTQGNFDDIENIDITSWVQSWVDTPSTNYGMLLRLRIETGTKRLILSSSDNADSTWWPKLEITYYDANSLDENQANANVQVFPNPASNKVTIQSNNPALESVSIVDVSGRVMYTAHPDAASLQIPTQNWRAGTYFVSTLTNGTWHTTRLTIE